VSARIWEATAGNVPAFSSLPNENAGKVANLFASCAKTRPFGLRGLAVVELEQAAEPTTAPGRACADRRGLGRDELIAQTLVRPRLMIRRWSYCGEDQPVAHALMMVALDVIIDGVL
jgi:hypothetical protein